MIKTYMTVFMPGIMFAETDTKRVNHRSQDRTQLGDNVYGFRYFDREEMKSDSGKVLMGAPENYSPNYYIGREMTLEQVKRELPDQKILILNMENNKYDRVVKTHFGQFIPLEKGDVVIRE